MGGLAVAALVLQYLQIVLPVLIVCSILFGFCCCLPTTVALLVRLHILSGHVGPHAATEEQIAALPPPVPWDPSLHSFGSGDCAVCMEDWKAGDLLRVLRCGHMFHAATCSDPWLKLNATCPVCRAPCLEGGGATAPPANGSPRPGGSSAEGLVRAV